MSMWTSSAQYIGWYNATTLSERIALRRRTVSASIPKNLHVEAAQSLRPRLQGAFTRASILQRREEHGIGEDEFLAILSEPPASIRARYSTTPSWLQHLIEAFSDHGSQTTSPFPDGASEPIPGLMNLARPLVTHGMSKLKDEITALLLRFPNPPLNIQVVEQIFLGAIARQLPGILSKVVVLELNVARVKSSLEGRTSEDRYGNFIENISRPEVALAVLLEYPVLARQLVIRIEQWIDVIVEFVDRLCSDWGQILANFGPMKVAPGRLTDVQTGAGDRHRGGRCVLIATFASGFRLVYKPKSMAADEHFQQLLSWINARGEHPPLRMLKVLDRGNYGWSECVTAEACCSLPEVQRFYQRQGAYLALLYVLEATDFHSENIIAAGEHPMLIDLEALFHPRLKVQYHPAGADNRALQHSVLRVGLLPVFGKGDEQSARLDYSGLGGAAGQFTPLKVPFWELIGTDEMRLRRRHMAIPGSENLPSLNGEEIVPSKYVQEIAAGFTSVYRLLMRHRDELVSRSRPLLCFANDEVRVILRATQTYAVLLGESFHPDVMRNALDRDLLFERLWVAVEACPYLARVISAECAALQEGDIPLFLTRPSSLHVWCGSDQYFASFFERSSLSVVEERLRGMDESDLNLQLWLIRASLAAAAEEPSLVGRHRLKIRQAEAPIDQARLLAAACTIGDKLESSALRWDENVSWIGLTAASDRQWRVSTTLLDLYDGLPGIALFLAYLGSVTGRTRYADLARQACNGIRARLEAFKSGGLGIGAFAGWGGIIYVLTHLASLWQDEDLFGEAQRIVPCVSCQIGSDESFDIIAGSAGCIGSLIALYLQRPSAEILTAAKACGEHLVASAKSMPNGVGWVIPRQTVPLSGFAHGAAGIAWALYRLAALTNEQVFRKTADAAIAYERTLFDPDTANWRDLRGVNGPLAETAKSSMTAWCHGAAGIGLARLAAGEPLDNERRREIDTALSTTIREGFGNNHSLCHGDAGNMELLLEAARVLGEERWEREALLIANGIAESISRNQYRCATPCHVESPGLMTGLAGIGYGLLRSAKPDRVSSVLTLQPVVAT